MEGIPEKVIYELGFEGWRRVRYIKMAGGVFPEDKIGNIMDLVTRVGCVWRTVKYPSHYSVGMGLGSGRVWKIWTRNTLQGEISKGLTWHFRDFKLNTTGKKKIEWVLAGVAWLFFLINNFFNLLGTCQLVNIAQLSNL